MSEKLDKLRASLEKERERRIKINNRIESIERRIQEAEAAEVNVGDKLLITGPTTGAVFTTLEEARVDLKPVQTVRKGQHFSMKADKIRPSDKLYKLVSVEELKKFKGLDIENKRG